MRVFALKSCDTCRRALAELRAAGREPEVVEVATGLAEMDVAAIVAALGPAAVNRSSATWRGLTEEERALPPARLIVAHPKVMKRPVIVEGAQVTAGWGAAERALWIG